MGDCSRVMSVKRGELLDVALSSDESTGNALRSGRTKKV